MVLHADSHEARPFVAGIAWLVRSVPFFPSHLTGKAGVGDLSRLGLHMTRKDSERISTLRLLSPFVSKDPLCQPHRPDVEPGAYFSARRSILSLEAIV